MAASEYAIFKRRESAFWRAPGQVLTWLVVLHFTVALGAASSFVIGATIPLYAGLAYGLLAVSRRFQFSVVNDLLALGVLVFPVLIGAGGHDLSDSLTMTLVVTYVASVRVRDWAMRRKAAEEREAVFGEGE